MPDILDALRSQIGDDVQQVYLPEALFKRAAAEIAALREALEAHRAWSYAEDHGIGSFDQRMVLCAHAQALTIEALAMAKGEPPPDYKGTAKMIVWPHVARVESDRETGAALVRECLAHEQAALAKAEPRP